MTQSECLIMLCCLRKVYGMLRNGEWNVWNGTCAGCLAEVKYMVGIHGMKVLWMVF